MVLDGTIDLVARACGTNILGPLLRQIAFHTRNAADSAKIQLLGLVRSTIGHIYIRLQLIISK